jgi:glyoxylase-like metal-dependent hydrolase (beta-lactamase superfamily II)
MADYLASLRLMQTRTPTTLLPAHGPAIVDGQKKLREYIAHRTMREDRVLAALSATAAASLAELLPSAYADTPRMLWPLAERSLRAHLDKLVKEARAVLVEPGRWTRS